MAARLITEIGWFRAVILFLLLLAFLSQLITDNSDLLNWSLAIFGGSILLLLHFSRSDIAFIQSISSAYRFVVALEYGILTLPLIGILLYKGGIIPCLLLLSFSIILPYILQGKFGEKTNWESHRSTPFPVQSYEWIAGFRRNWMVFFLLLGTGILFLWTHYLVGLIIAFGILTLVSAFYTKNEPRRFILLVAEEPLLFLLKKLIWGIGLYTLCTLPLWAGILLIFVDQFNYTILFWFINIVLISSVIVGKYAFYIEQKDMQVPLGTIFGLFCLCVFVPYLQILVPVLWGLLFMKAVRRLKTSVYAYA